MCRGLKLTYSLGQIKLNRETVAPGSRRLLKSQRSRAKQLVAMNVAGGNALLIE